MRFVVWGIGTNGEYATQFFGLDNIDAYIDSEPQYKNRRFHEKSIIDIDEYLEKYSNDLLVISPEKYREIENIVKNRNIKNYLIFRDILC